MLRNFPSYSFRQDENVPDFDDLRPIAFMDGECVLCSWGAKKIDKLDTQRNIRICPIQSDLGRAMLKHYGVDPNDPETWLFIYEGRAYSSSHAIIQVLRATNRLKALTVLLALIPQRLREWAYRGVARNRYLTGRTDLCAVASPSLKDRLIS